MRSISVRITPELSIGDGLPPVIIAGPCVIESEELCITIAKRMAAICRELAVPYIFKASFDKANRTSIDSFRGPGLKEGLKILAGIKERFSIPVLTDIHDVHQVEAAAGVVDVLQIPAFLSRQTDLLLEAGRSGKAINIKKGQFLAPMDMQKVVEKVRSTGNTKILLTERGASFGYNNLVVDMRSLVIMRSLGVPVVFDGTHSVQLPGGLGDSSGGQREFIPPLTRAAMAVGIDGLFLETHPNPDEAKSDGPNSIPLDTIRTLIRQGLSIHDVVTKGQNN